MFRDKGQQPGQRGCAIGLHGCFRLFSLEKYKSAAELEKLRDKGNHVIDYLSRKFAQVMMFCGVNHQKFFMENVLKCENNVFGHNFFHSFCCYYKQTSSQASKLR